MPIDDISSLSLNKLFKEVYSDEAFKMLYSGDFVEEILYGKEYVQLKKLRKEFNEELKEIIYGDSKETSK